MEAINLYFEDLFDSFYLIKFGHKEHLKQILNGTIRFTNLKKYQEEENKNIGDQNEGLQSIFHQNKNMKITFQHPLLEDGKEINISKSILLMKDFSSIDKYVSCFSFFNAQDVYNHTIFSDKILEEKEWRDVLLILDTNTFVSSINNTLKQNNIKFDKVQYVDFSKNQYNLNEFFKSNEYEHQKEIRFSIEYHDKSPKFSKIDNNTISIDLEKKFRGIIIPTKEFREGFSMTNY